MLNNIYPIFVHHAAHINTKKKPYILLAHKFTNIFLTIFNIQFLILKKNHSTKQYMHSTIKVIISIFLNLKKL